VTNPTTVYARAGIAYTTIAASAINLTVAGTFTGVTHVIWNPTAASGGATIDHVVTAGERTAGSLVIAIPGNDGAIQSYPINAIALQVVIDGTTVQTARSFTVAADLSLSGGIDGLAVNNRNLIPASTFTTWSLNGTILVASYANANTTFWNTRFYVWNAGTVTGNITARVYTLPFATGTHTLLGSAVVGSIGGSQGVNIRLAEDILANLVPTPLTVPYITNGGNLVVEFTIEAPNCTGWTQVFGGTTFMGIVPMTVTNILQ